MNGDILEQLFMKSQHFPFHLQVRTTDKRPFVSQVTAQLHDLTFTDLFDQARSWIVSNPSKCRLRTDVAFDLSREAAYLDLCIGLIIHNATENANLLGYYTKGKSRKQSRCEVKRSWVAGSGALAFSVVQWWQSCEMRMHLLQIALQLGKERHLSSASWAHAAPTHFLPLLGSNSKKFSVLNCSGDNRPGTHAIEAAIARLSEF